MDAPSASSLQESLAETYTEFMGRVVAHAPQVVGALLLLIIGFAVAHLLRIAARRLVGGFDSLFRRAAETDGARQEKMKGSYAAIVGRIVFWTVLTFFVAAAANLLGWQLFSSWMNSLVTYLPDLITGVLIILAGFLLGSAAKTAVSTAAHSTQLEQGETLARVVQAVVVLATAIIGIEHIGINVHFLSTALVVVLGVLLAGGALAFGLGAKNLVANIVGAQYVRKHCRVGEHLHIGDVSGTVAEVTQTSIVLDTESGRTVVPAKYFQEQISSFSSPGEAVSKKPDGEGETP